MKKIVIISTVFFLLISCSGESSETNETAQVEEMESIEF